MRKVLALLLLGAAAPALAAGAPGDRHGWQSSQQSTSDNHDNRSDNNDRPHADRGNRGNHDGGGNDAQHHPQQPVVHVEPAGGGGNGQVQPVLHVQSTGGGNADERRFHNGVRSRFSGGGEQPAIQPSGGDAMPSDTVHIRRGPKIVEPPHVTADDHPAATLREQHHPLPGVLRNRVPVVSNVPHEGTQPPLRVNNRSRDSNHHWNTAWRDNHRYDWQDWRRHHRSHFHLGLYYDPFGWSYQSYQIGWRLWPSYYGSQYWINDPYDYRLPYAPPGYRWIRYWDDAILVDTFTGEAVDVIHNFFW